MSARWLVNWTGCDAAVEGLTPKFPNCVEPIWRWACGVPKEIPKMKMGFPSARAAGRAYFRLSQKPMVGFDYSHKVEDEIDGSLSERQLDGVGFGGGGERPSEWVVLFLRSADRCSFELFLCWSELFLSASPVPNAHPQSAPFPLKGQVRVATSSSIVFEGLSVYCRGLGLRVAPSCMRWMAGCCLVFKKRPGDDLTGSTTGGLCAAGRKRRKEPTDGNLEDSRESATGAGWAVAGPHFKGVLRGLIGWLGDRSTEMVPRPEEVVKLKGAPR